MDPTTIFTMVSTASGLIKTVADLTTDTKVKEKTVAANNALIEIQSGLLTMQKESLELQQENDKLKRQIEQFNDWEKTKTLYKLVHTGGSIMYQPSDLNPIQEPKRYYCPNCFEQKCLSIAQYFRTAGNNHFCPKCKTNYDIK